MERGRPACTPWVLAITILVAFLPLLQATTDHDQPKCVPGTGLSTPGITTPSGDIILEVGTPLKINCTVYTSHPKAVGRNASDLTFYEGDKEVPAKYVKTVNETTIQLTVENLAMSTYHYYCKLRQSHENQHLAVCLNKVIVGTKPEEVQNFTCVSYNWERLECQWSVNENPIKTTYKIYFNLQGRAGRRNNATCPVETDAKKNMCMWSLSTNPIYRTPHEYYYFTLNGTNALTNVTFPYIRIHHYAHVIPSPPVNLQYHDVTHDSVVLTWDIPLSLLFFPPGLLHRVEYCSHWDLKDHWEIANTTKIGTQEKNITYKLTGLKYLHTEYTIRVMMKSSVAVGDSKWSAPAQVTIRTLSDIPGTSPKTDIGSFEIVGGSDGRRDVYIYWQRIPEYLQNGDNFEYKIIQQKENGEAKDYLTPSETTMSYAKIKGLSHNIYKFIIYAVNNVGESANYSVITIPSSNAILPAPSSFTKIAFGNGVYELSWKKPVDYMSVVNYTIFWCDIERDRPYQCTGFLNWTHVRNDENIVNITVPDENLYQFAISANTLNSSSGIIWATCTVIHNKGIGKMKNFWVTKVGSTSMEIGWKLECSDRIGLVKGYRIFYCPIVSPLNVTCRGPEKSKTVIGDAPNINVTDLMPYTTYMVAMSVMSRGGEGLRSDSQHHTTLEGAPEPPRSVTLTEVTNTSMVVSWSPPLLINGVLQYYEVHYNNEHLRVEGDTHVKLQSLPSYMNHTVYVTACTTSCSERSEEITAQTAVGNPGVPQHLEVRRMNVSQFLVEWREPLPSESGGYLDHYELEVEEVGADQNLTDKFSTIDTKYIVPVRDCKTPRTYVFRVRAVNIDQNNTYFYGKWSEPEGGDSCFDADIITQINVIIWTCCVVLCALLVLVIWVCGKKCWFCCKEMQNVEVKLPPGLDPPRDKDILTMSNCGGLHIPGDATSKKFNVTDSEARGLLLKNNERHGRNPSGDSSGCSSGHESVASSLASNNQISSDSGAEVDQLNGHSGMSVSVYDHAHPQKSQDGDTRYDLFAKQSHYNGSCGARSTPNLSSSLGGDTDSRGEVRSDTTRYTYLANFPSTGNLPSRSDHTPMASSSSSTLYCKVGSLEVTPTHATSYCKIGITSPPAVMAAIEDTSLRSQVPKGYITLARVDEITRAPEADPSSDYVSHPAIWSPPNIENTCMPPSVAPVSTATAQTTTAPQSRTQPFNDESSKEHSNVLRLECIPELGDSYSRVGCRSSWQAAIGASGSALSLTETVEPVVSTGTTSTNSYVIVGETPKTVKSNPTPANPPISTPIISPNSSGYVQWPCDVNRRPTASSTATTSVYVPHRQLETKCVESQPTDTYTRVHSVPNSPDIENNRNSCGSTGTSIAGSTAASM